MGYITTNGEPTDDAPTYYEALVLLDKAERNIKGATLQIAGLEADREADALNDPHRPEVELLHALWKKACRRQRALDANDREQMGRAIKREGFALCLRAVIGAAYDPGTRQLRNGTTERYDDLELIFREKGGKVHDFARRAPRGWQPDPERIAVIGGVSAAWVRDRLPKPKETA